jgi:hypothetical protein
MDEISVSADKHALQEIIAKGTVKDIGAFIKAQARANPDLVDPEAFEAQWNRSHADPVPTEFNQEAAENIGTKRAELETVLSKYDAPLAEAFQAVTPRQKIFDDYISNLSFCKTYAEIDKVNAWGEVEFGAMSLEDKATALFNSIGYIGTTPRHYRAARKIFLAFIADVYVDIRPEDLKAADAYQAALLACKAKLLHAKSSADIENCFDWLEVEIQTPLTTMQRMISFFQAARDIPVSPDKYKAIRQIFVRMNKD